MKLAGCALSVEEEGGSVSKENDADASEGECEEVSSSALQKSILAKVNSRMDMKEKLTSIEASVSIFWPTSMTPFFMMSLA